MADQHQKTSTEDEKINNIVIKLTVPGQEIFGVCKYLVLTKCLFANIKIGSQITLLKKSKILVK